MNKIVSTTIAALAMITFFFAAAAASGPSAGIGPEAAVARLVEGNNRFALGKTEGPNRGKERVREVATGQHPFAAVVCCSDSRVPPEILFDCGIGDIFIVRTAGHVVDDVALGSIEYAVEHLGVSLVVVLGHEKCGAVDATVKGGKPGKHIDSLVASIEPAVKQAREAKKGDLLDDSIRANIALTVEKLEKSAPVLVEMHEKGKIRIVGAYYEIDGGAVEFLAPAGAAASHAAQGGHIDK